MWKVCWPFCPSNNNLKWLSRPYWIAWSISLKKQSVLFLYVLFYTELLWNSVTTFILTLFTQIKTAACSLPPLVWLFCCTIVHIVHSDKSASWGPNPGNLAPGTAPYHHTTQPLKYNWDWAAKQMSESCQIKWQTEEHTSLYKGQAITRLQPIIAIEKCRLQVAWCSNFCRETSKLGGETSKAD